MKRLSVDDLEALAAANNAPIERDEETDQIYTRVGRVEYVAQLPARDGAVGRG